MGPLSAAEVRGVFLEEARRAGFQKRGTALFLPRSETVVVLDLHKSQYGDTFYANYGVWLTGLEGREAPRSHQCHIVGRLNGISDAAEDLDALLTAEGTGFADQEQELRAALRSALEALGVMAADEQALRTGKGQRLMQCSLVRGSADEYLQASP